MNTLRYALAVGAAMLVAGSSADAQLRRTTTATTYPDAQTMPSGMCRIWIEGLPANRQPAPTDCATARRNQPRNSRIIYGTRSTSTYGNRDPRSIPGTPQYDPRFDPRSSQYDPRLDPHNNGSYGNNGRYDNDDRRDDKADRKRDKEREKWERKRQKEREKEWKKAHKGHGDDHDEDDDRRGNRSNGTYGTYGRPGTTQQSCVDLNRDGICDNTQSTARVGHVLRP